MTRVTLMITHAWLALIRAIALLYLNMMFSRVDSPSLSFVQWNRSSGAAVALRGIRGGSVMLSEARHLTAASTAGEIVRRTRPDAKAEA